MRLNQAIAVERQHREQATNAMKQVAAVLRNESLFSGFEKTYEKNSEDGDDLPTEKNRVQVKAKELVEDIHSKLKAVFDVTATKDFGNRHATTTLEVDGRQLLVDVPVSYLLFLEQYLEALGGLIKQLPTLDPAEEWRWDDIRGLWKSEPRKTNRTKKIQKALVLHAPTDKHPAQTQLITVDEVVGSYQHVSLSGALHPVDKEKLEERIQRLLVAVKAARETANMQEVTPVAGAAVLDFLFE